MGPNTILSKMVSQKDTASQYTFEESPNVQFYVLSLKDTTCKIADYVVFLFATKKFTSKVESTFFWILWNSSCLIQLSNGII